MVATSYLLAGVAALLTTVHAAPRSNGPRDTICNGNSALCGRRYSDVTFIGSHDSAFVGELPTQNQLTSVSKQLESGIRFLQAQTHKKKNHIQLCHSSCVEENAGTLDSYLATIKSFLDANPNEVVSLLLTNGDNIPIEQFGTTFSNAGLADLAYAPSNTLALADWPTLGSMISSGKRLVVFMDFHADTTKVPYILDEFSYYYETPYDTTDADFPQCTIDRPAGASADGRMGIVNHFLDKDLFGILYPDIRAADDTNSKNSILAQTDLCVLRHNRTPNVVLLDYVSRGQAMDAQNALNNL